MAKTYEQRCAEYNQKTRRLRDLKNKAKEKIHEAFDAEVKEAKERFFSVRRAAEDAYTRDTRPYRLKRDEKVKPVQEAYRAVAAVAAQNRDKAIRKLGKEFGSKYRKLDDELEKYRRAHIAKTVPKAARG